MPYWDAFIENWHAQTDNEANFDKDDQHAWIKSEDREGHSNLNLRLIIRSSVKVFYKNGDDPPNSLFPQKLY